MSQLNPYLHFKDTTKAAMTFYHQVLGGKLDIKSFKDSGMSQGPQTDDLTMHSTLVSAKGFTIMASDTPPGMEYKPAQGISISLSGEGEDEAELRGYWEKLQDGATVTLPLKKAPWGDFFGMLIDKFGVTWMVDITPKKES